ncbi:hypothetical protein R1flu_004542 [Riccia fluitans]|uniref:Uncharacterized protein n=1 Tax=Riccia fluitans TaxID=41844 RepID=A0ABD1YQM7_9MARC
MLALTARNKPDEEDDGPTFKANTKKSGRHTVGRRNSETRKDRSVQTFVSPSETNVASRTFEQRVTRGNNRIANEQKGMESQTCKIEKKIINQSAKRRTTQRGNKE